MTIDPDPTDLAATIRGEMLDRLGAAGPRIVAGIRRRNHDDTGTLDASFTSELDEAHDRLLVGTPLLYGRFREIGTAKMRPHAPIRRTLAEDAGGIHRDLEG